MQSFLEIFDIYLLEAVVNGILLGGLLALLALGPEPDLRRHRRDVDLLRRAGDDRHVRHVLPRPVYGLSYWLAAPLASCWWRSWARCCTSW